MSKIIFSNKNRENGLTKHLVEATKIVKDSKYIPVDESSIERTAEKISAENPELVIFGLDWILDNLKTFDRIRAKKGVLFCSPYAQAEITSEIPTMSQCLNLLDKRKIDYFFVAPKEVSTSLKHPYILPFPTSLSKQSIEEMRKIAGEKIIDRRGIVSILNDKARHKNIANTLAGISESNAKKVIINGMDENYQTLTRFLGLSDRIRDIGFLSRKEFYGAMRGSELGIHLAFSEGFAYNILEYILLGTPCLVAESTPWFSADNRNLVTSYNNHHEIASKINNILKMSDREYVDLIQKNYVHALKKVEKNREIIKDTFGKF